jgi:DHA3 family macrolide efflux protein-like MFS transporter
METHADQATFRSYLVLWSGQLVSLLGSSVTQFVLIWWTTLNTGSPLFLALASFLGLAPMVVLGPFTGVFADRINRKVLLFIADALQACATVVLIVLFSLGNTSVWLVLALIAVRGVLQAFHQPTAEAIVPTMVPADKLSRMNGVTYLFTGAVSLMGPILGAVLLGIAQVQQVLWIDVATFLVAVTPLLIVQIPSVRSAQLVRASSFATDFKEGFGFIRATRGFLPLLMLATMLNFLLTPVSTLMPYYVKFDHLGDVQELALVSAAFQGGILAGGLLMTVTRGFRRKMTATAVGIYIVFAGYILVALTPTGFFWLMALGGVIMAICLPVANVSTTTIFQTIVPLKMQGRVNAVTMALASAATPLGMILSGAVVQFIPTSTFFLLCAALGLLILTLSWLFTGVKYVDQNAENNSRHASQLPSSAASSQ